MTMCARNVSIALLTAMAYVFSVSHALRSQTVPQNSEVTVVRVDKTPQGIAYRVNSKLSGHTSTTDILHILSLISVERGTNTPVVVLVDPRVSITDILNFDGVAGKAQLNNVRYFVFYPESKFMAELKWGPTQAFSTNPN